MRKYVPADIHLVPRNAQEVFTGEVYHVYQWPQKLYNGEMATFEMLSRADTVKIIPLVTAQELAKLDNVASEQPDEDLEIIITHQQQPGKNWFYDFPGGRVDPEDSDELAAAKRELREETGLEFRNWRLVEVHQPFSKIDWLVYTFVASGLIGQGPQDLDGGEKIELKAVTMAELQALSNEPDSQYLRFQYYDKIKSVSELKDWPSLYQY